VCRPRLNADGFGANFAQRCEPILDSPETFEA